MFFAEFPSSPRKCRIDTCAACGCATRPVNSLTRSPHDTVFLTTEGETLTASTSMSESQSLTDFFIYKNHMSQSAKVGSQIFSMGELPVSLARGRRAAIQCHLFFAVHVRVIRICIIVLSIQIPPVGLYETICVRRRAFQVVIILLFVTVKNAGQ